MTQNQPQTAPAGRPAATELEPDFSANDPGEPAAEGRNADEGSRGPAAPPKPFAFKSDAVAGVTLLEDRRYRQVQFQFAEKPSDGVRKLLRDAGYSWQPADRVWVHPIDRKAGWMTRLDAEKLFAQVVDTIGREQGTSPSR